MKKRILRWIYRRYQHYFDDFLVESFIEHMPEKLVYDGFDVIRSHKVKFQKFTNYLAHQLHRRQADDVKNSERYQGMFIQLKMINHMIGSRPDPSDTNPIVTQEEPADSKYEKFIESASNFAAKFTK